MAKLIEYLTFKWLLRIWQRNNCRDWIDKIFAARHTNRPTGPSINQQRNGVLIGKVTRKLDRRIYRLIYHSLVDELVSDWQTDPQTSEPTNGPVIAWLTRKAHVDRQNILANYLTRSLMEELIAWLTYGERQTDGPSKRSTNRQSTCSDWLTN